MNEKELLAGVLAKTLDKSPEEVSDLLYNASDDSDEVTLKENAIDLVLDEDVERVKKLKSSVKPNKETIKEIRDQEKFNVMDEFEKKLRGTYGIDSTSRGLDLVKEIIDQVSECDISDEKVKLHPAYLDLELRKTKEIETLQENHNDYKLNQDKISRLTTVKSKVMAIFSSLNPIESQNTVVAQTRREDFLNKFEQYDYELQDNGDLLILQNGKRLEDPHGNAIKFTDFVKDVAEQNYDFAQSDARGQAGNQDGNGSGSHIDVPKDEKEYLALMNNLILQGDKEGGIKLAEAWNASQNK